jgi:hypothetical protein
MVINDEERGGIEERFLKTHTKTPTEDSSSRFVHERAFTN